MAKKEAAQELVVDKLNQLQKAIANLDHEVWVSLALVAHLRLIGHSEARRLLKRRITMQTQH